MVIAPNGTGALIADIPDGTATGGNARGTNAVDLQTSRNINTQVASNNLSTIIGGQANIASGPLSVVIGGINNQSTGNTSLSGMDSSIASGQYSIAIGQGVTASANFSTSIGGQSNTSSGSYSTVIGGVGNNASGQGSVFGGQSNTASSNNSTVSGGQSNTASTGTHATVVGGISNTASGTHATVLGGSGNTASGVQSIAGGIGNIASGPQSLSLGLGGNAASGQASVVLGYGSFATNFGSIALCDSSLSYLKAQVSIASGTFSGFPSQRGEAQQSLLTARREATLASNATTVLSLDGTGVTNLLIPLGNNRVWAVKVIATAVVSYALPFMTLGDSYMAEYTLLFKKIGGVSSVVGVIASNVIFNTNMVDASFSFAAGASQDLQITFKAPSISGFSIYRCVARVELTEVTY